VKVGFAGRHELASDFIKAPLVSSLEDLGRGGTQHEPLRGRRLVHGI